MRLFGCLIELFSCCCCYCFVLMVVGAEGVKENVMFLGLLIACFCFLAFLLLLFVHAFGVVFSILVLCTDALLTGVPSAAAAPFS